MPTVAPHPSVLALRQAMEAGDAQAAAQAFAPNAVFRSPLTARLTFTGREQIEAVTRVVVEVFHDFRYIDELHGDGSAVLVAKAAVGDEDLEIVDHLLLDAEGRIEELTVFFRPLPAAARALQAIGAGFGRRVSPRRGALLSTLTAPLAWMVRIGDALGVPMIRSTL